jgi:hypothetical protein
MSRSVYEDLLNNIDIGYESEEDPRTTDDSSSDSEDEVPFNTLRIYYERQNSRNREAMMKLSKLIVMLVRHSLKHRYEQVGIGIVYLTKLNRGCSTPSILAT